MKPPATAPSPPRPMRADARRNREAILDAARRIMGAGGIDVGMDEIAREAGVGVGTLYRHFPTKDDLIEALADIRFETLAEFARDALADPEPHAFERFLYRAGELHAADRSLGEVVRELPEAMSRAAERVGLLELTRAVLRRAQEAGEIRPDAEAEDVPMIMCGLGTTTPGSPGPFVTETSWRRYLGIAVDGLRAGGRSELPPR